MRGMVSAPWQRRREVVAAFTRYVRNQRSAGEAGETQYDVLGIERRDDI